MRVQALLDCSVSPHEQLNQTEPMPAQIPTPHRLLLVDDDAQFLDTISQLFLAWSGGAWQVHLATTTARALAILQEQQLDLVVMDIRMPVMDGLQFLALLNRKYPALRKVVMTGHADEQYRTNCLNSGAELFLEKPRTPEGFETVFATLNELAALQPQEGFRGMLRQVSLQDIIQMECLARNSSILEISNRQVRGRIFIEQGAIIHAELGPVSGEAAFNNLLCLRGGEFSLKPFAAPPEHSISGQWEFLLMEAARMKDELAELTSTATEPQAMPSVQSEAGSESVRLAPAPLPAPQDEIRIDELVVCTGQSDVLYEWQCHDLDARLRLFNFVSQHASQFAQNFPLGRFDRLEVLGPQGRMVAQFAPDRKLFLRCSPIPPATGQADHQS